MRRLLTFLALLLLLAGFLDFTSRFEAAGAPVSSEISPASFWANYDGEVRTVQFSSKLLMQNVSYRIILPTDYNRPEQAGARYPVVYLLHGLGGHFDNWTSKTDLAKYASRYQFIVVTPEGNDGWYTDSATVTNDKYESYILKELIPEIDRRYRTLADRSHRAIAGLSMGGYGAIKFGLKYPEMFSLVGSFSGALGAASVTEKEFGPANAITRTIFSVFGKEDNAIRKENDVFAKIRALTPDLVSRLPFIYQSCGTEDFLFQNNRDFNELLIEKKVPHEYRETPGAHSWTFWDEQVKQFLELADRRLIQRPLKSDTAKRSKIDWNTETFKPPANTLRYKQCLVLLSTRPAPPGTFCSKNSAG